MLGLALTEDQTTTPPPNVLTPVTLIPTSTTTEHATITLTRTPTPAQSSWGFFFITPSPFSYFVISAVIPGSIADKAGLRVGDFFLSLTTHPTPPHKCHTPTREFDVRALLTDSTTMCIQLSKFRPTTQWQAKYPDKSLHSISTLTARAMASSHRALTITVITLDSSGTVGPAEFTTMIPNSAPSHDKEPDNDATKYLGVLYSLQRGVIPQREKIIGSIGHQSRAAGTICNSGRSLAKNTKGGVFSSAEHALAVVPFRQKDVNNLRQILTNTEMTVIQLPYFSSQADRTSSITFLPFANGGLNIPDPALICIRLALSGLHRLANTLHPVQMYAMPLSLQHALTPTGKLRTDLSPHQKSAVSNSQPMGWISFLRDQHLIPHRGGGHSTLPAATLPTYESLSQMYIEVDDPRLKPLATVCIAPHTDLLYIPSQFPERFAPDTYGSVCIFAAIASAKRNSTPYIHITSSQNLKLQYLHTEDIEKV